MHFDKESLFIFALVIGILCIIYYTPLSEFKNSIFDKTIFLQPVTYSQFNSILASQEQEKYTNVPDYSANIYITPTGYLESGKPASFFIQIEDTSNIQKIKRPYFYVTVFNTKGELKYIFPRFGQYPYNEPWGSMSGNFLQNKQWTPWQDYSQMCSINELEVDSACFERSELISGRTNIFGLGNLEYSFAPDEPGEWSVYVFLFDENYTPRKNTLPYGQLSENAIASQKGTLHIGNQAKGNNILIQLLISAILLFGAFIKFNSMYLWLKKGNKLMRIVTLLKSRKKWIVALIMSFIIGILFGLVVF